MPHVVVIGVESYRCTLAIAGCGASLSGLNWRLKGLIAAFGARKVPLNPCHWPLTPLTVFIAPQTEHPESIRMDGKQRRAAGDASATKRYSPRRCAGT